MQDEHHLAEQVRDERKLLMLQALKWVQAELSWLILVLMYPLSKIFWPHLAGVVALLLGLRILCEYPRLCSVLSVVCGVIGLMTWSPGYTFLALVAGVMAFINRKKSQHALPQTWPE